MPSITVAGQSFDIPDHYAPSVHLRLLPSECAVLNAARRGRIREAFAKAIDTGEVPAGKEAEALSEFIANFKFNVASPGRSAGALDRAIWRMASDLAGEELRKRGKERGSLSTEQWHSLVTRIASTPSVRSEAERRLAASRSIAEDVLDLGDLS